MIEKQEDEHLQTHIECQMHVEWWKCDNHIRLFYLKPQIIFSSTFSFANPKTLRQNHTAET